MHMECEEECASVTVREGKRLVRSSSEGSTYGEKQMCKREGESELIKAING